MYFQSNPKREDGKNKNSPFKILSNGKSIQGKEKSPSRDYENSIAQEIPKEMGYILFESLTLPIKNQNKYGTRDVKTEKGSIQGTSIKPSNVAWATPNQEKSL
jgi:hypothetical protein